MNDSGWKNLIINTRDLVNKCQDAMKTEGEGFLAEFYEREDPEKQHVESVKAARTCSDKWKLDASFSPQELTSPGWPNKYPLNTNCFWRIRAPTPSRVFN